jgi:hypothetical protein
VCRSRAGDVEPQTRRYTLVSASSAAADASFGQTATVVSFCLSVTFACGLFIAVAHVVNTRFIAPVYDVAANLVAFGSAVAASVLLGHTIPAILAGVAIVCWLGLARRTLLDRRERRTARSL